MFNQTKKNQRSLTGLREVLTKKNFILKDNYNLKMCVLSYRFNETIYFYIFNYKEKD